jgi:DNA-binding response OmpR family regulator
MAGESILVINPDKISAGEMAESLVRKGYRITVSASLTEAKKVLLQMHPYLVILVWDPAPGEGEDRFVDFRQASDVPLLIIGAAEYLIEMLESGADATLVSPPSPVELLARVHSMLRRFRDYQPPGQVPEGTFSLYDKETGAEGLPYTQSVRKATDEK